ncbi:MAG: DUF2786 domain-containing protein [Rhodococcus sp. (in: high G+C Gram-positive bacteria)]
MNDFRPNRVVDIDTLMMSGIALAIDSLTNGRALDSFVDHVIEIESSGSIPALDRRCVTFAGTSLDGVFERGWQPVELLHVAMRRLDKPCSRMLVGLLGAHSLRTRALSAAPAGWRAQLIELDIDPGADVVRSRRTNTADSRVFWSSLFRVLAVLRRLPTLTVIAPPPSRWGIGPVEAGPQHADVKVLNKIRGLLSKAESTTFGAEAEAFSSKAQELMTRYAIDNAVLASTEGRELGADVVTRRLTLDNPYADAKYHLLAGVAVSNGAKTVFYSKLGLVSVTGMAVDLDLCELLYTSLLVQSSHALSEAGTDRHSRSRGFRRAFLLGYAWRISERLAEAKVRADQSAGQTYGSSLVPILAERDKAVSSVFRDLYPDLRSTRVSVSDRSGLGRGRAAAELADLTGGRERLDK